MVSTRSKEKSEGLVSPDKPPRPTRSTKTPQSSKKTASSSTKQKSSTKKTPQSNSKSQSTATKSVVGYSYSSDECEFSDADSLAVTTQGNNNNSNNSSSKKKREPLPHNVEKQVLIDIEEAGGLYSFKYGEPQALDKLLNNKERENVYGTESSVGEGSDTGSYCNRGDKIREKIRKRVYYIQKNWSKEKYLSHLGRLRILPYSSDYGKKEPEEVPAVVGSNIKIKVEKTSNNSNKKIKKEKKPLFVQQEEVSDLDDDEKEFSNIPTEISTTNYSVMNTPNSKYLPPVAIGAIFLFENNDLTLFNPLSLQM